MQNQTIKEKLLTELFLFAIIPLISLIAKGMVNAKNKTEVTEDFKISFPPSFIVILNKKRITQIMASGIKVTACIKERKYKI